jgi:hypothetical protein
MITIWGGEITLLTAFAEAPAASSCPTTSITSWLSVASCSGVNCIPDREKEISSLPAGRSGLYCFVLLAVKCRGVEPYCSSSPNGGASSGDAFRRDVRTTCAGHKGLQRQGQQRIRCSCRGVLNGPQCLGAVYAVQVAVSSGGACTCYRNLVTASSCRFVCACPGIDAATAGQGGSWGGGHPEMADDAKEDAAGSSPAVARVLLCRQRGYQGAIPS